MKAAYKSERKKGLQIVDIPEPVIHDNEVLIRVKSAAICGTDLHLYDWNSWCENVKAKNPMVIGHEFCGEVVDTGKDVKQIKKGDLVAAETHIPCGVCRMCRTGKEHICQNMKIIGVHTDGAFAEYTAIPEVCAWKLPGDTPPNVGAIYEPFGIAVNAVLKDKVAGRSVAIIGCGPIGLFAVNVASVSGASEIFAIDINEFRLDMATKMGQNIQTLNPTRLDVVKYLKEKTEDFGVEVVIELSGSTEGVQTGFEILSKAGWMSIVGLGSERVPIDLVNHVIYKQATIYGITGREMFQSWFLAQELIGKCPVHEVITHEFLLTDIEEAILTVKEGKCGKAIIKISDS